MLAAILEKTESYILSNKALLIILSLTFLVRLPSFFEPLWNVDEAIYSTIGQEINRGGLLYVDIFDHKTPGIYYLAAWSFTILGETLWSLKFMLTFWVLTTLVVYYSLVQKLFDRKTALFSVLTLSILTSTPFLAGNIFNNEIIAILPICLAIFLGLKKRYLLSGAFFSSAILLNLPAFFAFSAFFIFLALSINNEKSKVVILNLVKLTVGLVIPFGLTFVYFASKGALASYINTAFLFNLSYTNYGNEFIIPNGLLIVKALPLIAIAAYFFWRVLSKKGKSLSGKFGTTEFLLIWLIFSYYGAVFGGRPYIHYMIQPLAPLSIIIGRTITKAKFRKFGVAITSFALLLSFLLGFLPNVNLRYYPNFFNFILNRTSSEDYQNSFDLNTSRIYSISSLVSGCFANQDSKECENLRTNSKGSVYLWGNQPAIYFLSQREPASKYITAFHILGSDSAKKVVIQELRKDEPAYILVDEFGPKPFPELDSLIKKRYNLFAASEGYKIYVLGKNSQAF